MSRSYGTSELGNRAEGSIHFVFYNNAISNKNKFQNLPKGF